MATAGTVVKRRPFLRGMKVRIKELAQEAKFIRLEENRIKKEQLYIETEFDWEKYPEKETDVKKHYQDLYTDHTKLKSHRKCNVREAARAAQLAYAFLRGVPYSVVEGKRKPEKEWSFNYRIKPEIKRLANKFGCVYTSLKESYDDDIEKWLNA